MNFLSAFSHLFFPRTCLGCGSDAISGNELICYSCYSELPMTHYNIKRNNKAEKIFYGRVDISFAMSLLYFSNVSVVQNLIHELKYNGRKDVGILLGKMMGRAIGDSDCFNDIDYIVPLPLSKRKKLIRGYNQSELLCDGISKIVQKPVLIDKVIRSIDTASQTRKHRKERWQNVEKIFVHRIKLFRRQTYPFG